MFDDITSVALHSALRGLAQRQRTIADNVANISTPQFLAGKVAFEDELAAAVASGDSAVVSPSLARSLEPTREDGNNVNLDTESLASTDTEMRYQLMTTAVGHQFSLMRTSMRTN